MKDYYDLGTHSRAIITGSPQAQKWFDRGFIWCIAFNHDEAISCFKHALKADPTCAMAHWGVAYAAGCNYNKPWEAFDAQDAKQSLATAFDACQQGLKYAASGAEHDLIKALTHRYAMREPAADMCPWNDKYATEMRKVYAKHSTDLDIAALFAEALINRTPWALWDLKTGQPATGADTLEAKQILEKAMLQTGAMQHPGILHMYIHLIEMSPMPEDGLKAADALRGLVPDAGHLNHMPTHLDVICGHYERVVSSNEQAIIADRKFLKRTGPLNFYSLYRCHDYHFKIYGAMFLGQYQPALDAANEMIETLPDKLLQVQSPPMADWLEGFISMKQHVYIRFGKWQEIIDQELPQNAELFAMTTATMLYAKAVAYAASGDAAQGQVYADRFDAAVKNVPEGRFIFNNSCADILKVAREMMLGEIEYRLENYDTAFAHLRKSVALDDTLPYDEPWGWMQPSRHALGALLLEQGHIEESAAVYRADLGLDDTLRRACQHPDNVWSLIGYYECLVKLGKVEEAHIINQRLTLAKARTDITVKSSCFCKIGSF